MIDVLILVAGKRYSGKDEIVKRLSDVKKDVKRVAYADAVKQEYVKIYTREHPFESTLTVGGLNADRNLKEAHRHGLINLGEFHRNTDSSHWIKKALGDVDAHIVAVTDVRYMNELITSSLYANYTIRVYMDSSVDTRVKRGYAYDKFVDEHETENQVNPINIGRGFYDMIVKNEKDTDLSDAVDGILDIVENFEALI